MASVDLNVVLERINKARNAQGLPSLNGFPKGQKSAPESCPIANGLNGFCSVSGIAANFQSEAQAKAVASVWGVTSYGKKVYLPNDLKAFVTYFDDGNAPELVGEKGEIREL